MADIQRTAEVNWQGDSRSGKGNLSTGSGVLKQVPYTWHMRFEDEPGTNPEELIVAAHAGCFTMAFAGALARKGFVADSLHTNGTLIMEMVDGKQTVTRVRLEVEGKVPNIDEATFQQTAAEAEQGCPISRLLRPGLKEVEVVARLV
jgi:lipoyl-dependent peroxiredoxin